MINIPFTSTVAAIQTVGWILIGLGVIVYILYLIKKNKTKREENIMWWTACISMFLTYIVAIVLKDDRPRPLPGAPPLWIMDAVLYGLGAIVLVLLAVIVRKTPKKNPESEN